MAHLLVTGGAGYIGSHTVLALLARGHWVTVVDSFVNASPVALTRVAELAGDHAARLACHTLDLCCPDAPARLHAALDGAPPVDGVIHFAALKAVGDSVANPLLYYQHNLSSSLHLCAWMQAAQVKTIVFSSSATVYGDPDEVPVREGAPIRPANPYGQTKAMMEQILVDAGRAAHWSVVNLRYFNPVGAHPSGRIGEDPRGIPNNLTPYVAQVAAGLRRELTVHGGDWPTADGTGVRDYIHVCDLADAHVAAFERLHGSGRIEAINLGTSQGASVLEVVAAYRTVSGQPIPYRIGPRRPGDVACVVADPSKAHALLGWRATRSLTDMVQDSWRWQAANPLGYASDAAQTLAQATAKHAWQSQPQRATPRG